MNTTIKLSVSSVLLAGFMTGCSQQQFQGGGQQIAGGSQVAGGQQILGGGQQIVGGGQSAGGQQVMGGQQLVGGGQSAGGQQVLGGQQQSAGVDSQVQHLVVPTATTSHMHDATIQSTEHLHDVKPEQRVYVPLPESMKEKVPAVFMYDQPKPAPAPQAEPVYYDPEPVYYDQAQQAAPTQLRRPKPMPQQRPVVRHKGLGMPPAQPGQCFAKVNTPAKFKNTVKRVQVSPAVNKRVKVRGPQYTWVTKKVLARPATQRNEYVPAQYRNITKKVLVKPAHYAWQKNKTGPVTRIDHMTGEILCRVKIPAVYRTVTQRVIARPAQRLKRNIPAVYRTVKQKKLASPAVYRTIKTPARFVNKTYRVQTSGPSMQWKPIACKPAKSQQRQVQRAPQGNNAQIRANQLRRAQHAAREKQRLARHAQKRRLAQQAHQARAKNNMQARPAVRKQVPTRVSAEQRQLAIEFNRQQQILRQQWIQQEAARKRQAHTKAPVKQYRKPQVQQRRHVPQNNNAQIRANQQRRLQHAARERQRLARVAQQRKLAQQARLRQVQIAKQKRMAQHNANLLAQRKAAQMRQLDTPQPSYAKPKARPAQRFYAPKPRQHQVHRPKVRAYQQPKVQTYQQPRVVAPVKQQPQVQQVLHAPKPRVQPQPQMARPQPAPVNDNTPLTRANAVFKIQNALLQRGFNPGAIDGKLGPATVKALTAFQKTKGLKTGTLNRDTLRALSLVN